MSADLIKPDLHDGMPHCSLECPSHDGKRCELTGMHGDTFCGPQARLWDEQSTTFAVKYAQLRELFKVTHLSLEVAITFLEEFVDPDIRGDGLKKRVGTNLPRLQEVERKARDERAKMKWTCHAKPAALGGKTCGHKNAEGIVSRSNRLLCCEECGCTKIASDSRKAEAQ